MENNDIAVLSSNSHQPGIKSVTGSVCSVCLNDLRQIEFGGTAVESVDYEELLSKYLKAKFGEEENRPPSQYFSRKRKDTPEILVSEVSIGVSEKQRSELMPIETGLFEAIVAPYFGPFAVSLAAKHLIILVPQPISIIKCLMKAFTSQEDLRMEVNLKHQEINVAGLGKYPFKTEYWLRTKLLQGLDDMDELRLHQPKYSSHLGEDKIRRPWLYEE
jgi:3-isopropylmalate dehydratase small subunit